MCFFLAGDVCGGVRHESDSVAAGVERCVEEIVVDAVDRLAGGDQQPSDRHCRWFGWCRPQHVSRPPLRRKSHLRRSDFQRNDCRSNSRNGNRECTGIGRFDGLHSRNHEPSHSEYQRYSRSVRKMVSVFIFLTGDDGRSGRDDVVGSSGSSGSIES